MKKIFIYTLPVFALCAMASCSDDLDEGGTSVVDPNAGKELIAFSPEVGDITRAGTPEPEGFSATTKVVARIKAQNGVATEYRYTQTILTAGSKVTAGAGGDACNLWGLSGEHSHLSYSTTTATEQTRYWDDAFGRASKLTVYAVAVPGKTDDTVPDTKLDQTGGTDVGGNWYTIASENTQINWTVGTKQDATTMAAQDLLYSNNISELYTDPAVAAMKGRYHQTYNSGESDWTKSMLNGRLAWQERSSGETIGKFDQGHLVFQHALTYLEINLTEGAGFDNTTASDFDWTNKPSGFDQSITLTTFNTGGDLDLSLPISNASLWTNLSSSNIQQLKETVTGGNTKTITLEGYVIPGTSLDDVSTNVLQFEIDDIKYYVSGDQIAEAIKAHDSGNATAAAKTLAGKHYVINLTVGKRSIDNITAAILPWEEVNSTNIIASNTHCTFSFEDRGTPLDGTTGNEDKFDIYRAAQTITSGYIDDSTDPNYDWLTAYAGPAIKSYDTDHWKTTTWYWPDNKTYYHFRAAGKGESASGSSPSIYTDGSNGDYFTFGHGPVDGSGANYKDYVWGAPFVDVADTYKFNYSPSTGFAYQIDGTTYQISKAIGATTDQIKMLLFHMTSQIYVNVKTSLGADKVTLKSGDNNTTVEILNFRPTGTVRMGTGKVEASGTRVSTATMTTGNYIATNGTFPDRYTGFSYGLAPQSLTESGGQIDLKITTPDGNTYYVRDLSTVTAELEDNISQTNLRNPYTETATSGVYQIDAWYPHYKYNYNITITKKGVDNITAAILPWETVAGSNIDINLEN